MFFAEFWRYPASFRIHSIKSSHSTNRYTAIKRGHVRVGAIDAISEILEISVAARRDRYSWFPVQKAHLYVHLHRKVLDLYCCAEFSTYALSKSHRSILVQILLQIRHKYRDLYYLHTRFTLFAWDRNPFNSFSFAFYFNYSIPLLIRITSFAVFDLRCFIETIDSDCSHNDGREQCYSYYSVYL